MSEYLFSDATIYTFTQLSEMHNSSFKGYFVPLDMTPQMLSDFWRANQIDANCSVAMHDLKGVFVGLARMGRRGRRGWCGGLGITPEFRGSGASRILTSKMVEVAREAGLKTLQLEVLTQNIRALKLYEKTGFTIHRKLFGLEIATTNIPASKPLVVEHVPFETVIPQISQHSIAPCWACELASLQTLNTDTIVTHSLNSGINALVVQHSQGKTRVLATVLQEDLTDLELASLLREAAGSDSTIQIYNEPEGSLFLARCRRLGFTEFFSQYEMFMDL